MVHGLKCKKSRRDSSIDPLLGVCTLAVVELISYEYYVFILIIIIVAVAAVVVVVVVVLSSL